MNSMKIKRSIWLVVLLTVVGLVLPSISAVQANVDNPTNDLPSPLCDSLQVPAGNELAFKVYARGVQIYTWDGTKWVNVPMATLYADPGYQAQVGIHYSGPTWESNSGSYVKAARKEGCVPDPSAIAWLKLEATSTSGPGAYSNVTFIHRLHTTGGIGPTAPGAFPGQSVEVPYTAVYYFYKASN